MRLLFARRVSGARAPCTEQPEASPSFGAVALSVRFGHHQRAALSSATTKSAFYVLRSRRIRSATCS